MFSEKSQINAGDGTEEIVDYITLKNGKTVPVYGESVIGKSKIIYSEHFIVSSDKKKLIWSKIMEQQCEFDLHLKLLLEEPLVTDFTQDGVAEVWFLYKSGCVSGISPLNIVLTYHQGEESCESTGTAIVEIDEKRKVGGEYKVANCFTQNNEINIYADSLLKVWSNKVETFE